MREAQQGCGPDPLPGGRPPTPAPAGARALPGQGWTVATAIAACAASVAVVFLMILILPTPRMYGLSVFERGQLLGFLAETAAAVVLVASSALATRARGTAGIARAMGWGGGRRALRASVALGVVLAAIVYAILALANGSAGYLPWSGGFACYALGAVVAAPLLEESCFRGILLPALAQRVGAASSFLIVTAVFRPARPGHA